MTYLENADYFIRYMNMPSRIHAFVMLNEDGTYSVYLDPRRDPVCQKRDFEHEFLHIFRGDLHETSRTATEIEDEMQKM